MSDKSLAPLEEQVAGLTQRVWRLEAALRQYGIVLPTANVHADEASPDSGPEASPPPLVPDSAESPSVAPPPAQQLFAAMAGMGGDEERESLESRIGSRWFNRVGILAVLIAVAWFLKLAIDNHWIGPLGRVAIGLVAGAGLVAWAERFRRRGFAVFSYSLKAIGSGALYLSLWAAFQLYHLLPGGVAFAAMILVTVMNGAMAWLEDSELLAAYAVAGALSTPALISTGENHEFVLFAYLLMLDLAVVALVALKPWARLAVGAFAGTVVFYCGWYSSYYARSALSLTAIFAGLFFALFAVAPRLAVGNKESDSSRSLWDGLLHGALPVANALFGFLAFYALLDEAGYHDPGAWLAVALAAFYLLLLNLPERGWWRKSSPLLDGLHLTAAVTFLTIAIPLKAHGCWVTLGWLVEGTALYWLESRISSRLLRLLALGCLALGVGATVVVDSSQGSSVPLWNARFGCYLASMAALAVVGWLSCQRKEADGEPELLPGKSMAALSVLGINLLILLGVGWEIDSFWWVRLWKGQEALRASFEIYAQFTYSAFFMLFGGFLLALGFWRRSSFLRWQALVLIAATIAKVFLGDMSVLSQGYRILSFLGLGVLLLAVSFVYQKDWLQLRGGAKEQP